MPEELQKLIGGILTKTKKGSRVIIAISGFGGSGKTTLAKQLEKELPDAAVISVDDFIIRSKFSERTDHWNSIDWLRLIEQVLSSFKNAGTVNYQVYDWQADNLDTWRTILQKRFLIIESVGLLQPLLLPYFDYSVWIDYPFESAMKRGMERDKARFSADNIHLWESRKKLWEEVWIPNDREYFAKHRPDTWADFVYHPEIKHSLK